MDRDPLAAVTLEIVDTGDCDLTGKGIAVEVARHADGTWHFWNVRIDGMRFGGNQPIFGSLAEALERRWKVERQKPCPNDTNGDGDCGRAMCPWCGGRESKHPSKATGQFDHQMNLTGHGSDGEGQ